MLGFPTCRWSLFSFFSHALFRSLSLVFLNTLPPLLPTPSSYYAPALITELFFHTSSVTWSLSGRSPWVGSPLWIASFPYLIPPFSPLSAPALPLAHDLQISQNLSRTIGSSPPKLLPVHFKVYNLVDPPMSPSSSYLLSSAVLLPYLHRCCPCSFPCTPGLSLATPGTTRLLPLLVVLASSPPLKNFSYFFATGWAPSPFRSSICRQTLGPLS